MMTGKIPLFSPGSTVSSALPGYVALCLALQVHRLASAQFTVTGPDRPITAPLGGEAILPCHLSPRMSAENMELRWFRSEFAVVVHLYRDGQDQYGHQMPEYQGRTELLKGDIKNGSVSLRIRDIRPSDDGQYKCVFQSSVSSKDAFLELQVAGLGSAPAISVEGHQDGGIRVVCRSSGWYPQPEAQWRDLQGQLLSSASEKIFQEADGLFQTEIAIVITEESNQKVSCCVRNLLLNQERESAISIAELFFPRVNPGLVALGMILAVLAVLIPLASYCFWRQHRAKETLRSELESEKEMLRSDLESEKAAHQAEKDKLQAELRWRSAQIFAVDVTLDPDTANPNLILSEDRKCVRCGDTRQDLPNNPERFDPCPSVLGAEGFTGGSCYWEVEVGDKTRWDLGVCRESVSRKGWVTATPEDGFWVVWLRDGEYKALTYPWTPLRVKVRPRRVGIFLDYQVGEVSFYNVTDRSHLFTFTGTFSGTLRPYFYAGVNTSGTNAAPLKICPVPAQNGGNLCP
ncbi:butyrophilin subfamily 1 member A1-like [Malaclemys terrapin pileata]|uniref:butyrophilin subfamily 1 member A1-like n=1 Tax=Malaclemys terrapin pileata TaxID=2991368 RepID=UPI0023A8BF36|nr:butyrophilin subfamily 1 member A1-like [Malaclemys terrapin pileata]XP_053902574.1 butyrophilin subfamily 1 member A1-like [Malaclemys terrapin pileata]